MRADVLTEGPSHTIRMLGTLPGQPDRPGGTVRTVRLCCDTLSVEVLSLGATLVDAVHHSEGRAVTLLSALEDWTQYDDPDINHFIGSTMGRWCRSMIETEVRIDDRVVQLTPGPGGRHAHGGPAGFHRQVWDVRVEENDPDSVTAVFHLVSPAEHQGYPGEVHADVTYRLRRGGVLEVGYRATTTEPTLLGMGNHVYWRIGHGPIDDLELCLPASRRLDIVDEVPSPESPIPVEGEHDFRTPRRIGTQSVDNYYIAEPGNTWRLGSPAEGVGLCFTSSEAGAGIYTGDHDRTEPRRGVAIEFGGWPGAERRPDFPSPIVRPGRTYTSSWSLSVEELGRP